MTDWGLKKSHSYPKDEEWLFAFYPVLKGKGDC